MQSDQMGVYVATSLNLRGRCSEIFSTLDFIADERLPDRETGSTAQDSLSHPTCCALANESTRQVGSVGSSHHIGGARA